MCADIRDGREQLLPSKGRIQMSKTNYLQALISDLQRTAGPYISARSRLMHRPSLLLWLDLCPQCKDLCNNALVCNRAQSSFDVIRVRDTQF